MNTGQVYFYYYKQKLADCVFDYKQKLADYVFEQQRRNNIKEHGYCPLHLVTKYNVAIEDAGRYRWLRDSGHLDAFWSVDGTEVRCDNIDVEIEDAMAEHALHNMMADLEKEEHAHDKE